MNNMQNTDDAQFSRLENYTLLYRTCYTHVIQLAIRFYIIIYGNLRFFQSETYFIQFSSFN